MRLTYRCLFRAIAGALIVPFAAIASPGPTPVTADWLRDSVNEFEVQISGSMSYKTGTFSGAFYSPSGLWEVETGFVLITGSLGDLTIDYSIAPAVVYLPNGAELLAGEFIAGYDDPTPDTLFAAEQFVGGTKAPLLTWIGINGGNEESWKITSAPNPSDENTWTYVEDIQAMAPAAIPDLPELGSTFCELAVGALALLGILQTISRV